MHINYYNSWSQPTVQKNVAINEWLQQIKHSDFSKKIIEGRSNEALYDEIKGDLPCVTYNFLFEKYKKNENIIQSTGWLYIDIDCPLFDVSAVDLNKIYTYYRSYGGVGYSLIVKVRGLTVDNFNSTYLDICEKLNILEFIDSNAIKPSQFTVLSYDPNIFINPDCYIFNSIYKKNTNLSSKFSPTTFEKNKNITYTNELGEFFRERQFIRYTNLDEHHFQGNYTCDWEEGFSEIKCSIPYKKLKDCRKRCLLAYTANLMYLNPFLKYDKLLSIILKVNLIMCEDPLKNKIVEGIAKSIYRQYTDGNLQPHFTKRRIIFSKDSCLNGKEKSILALKLYGDHKVALSKAAIYNTIEAWDFELYGKITSTKVCEISKLNIKTVEKYWKEFKDFVKDLNADYIKHKQGLIDPVTKELIK